jgi:hypothetical protein
MALLSDVSFNTYGSEYSTQDNQVLCKSSDGVMHALSMGAVFTHYRSGDYGVTWDAGITAMYFKGSSYVSYINQSMVPYNKNDIRLIMVNWQSLSASWPSNYCLVYSFWNGSSWTNPMVFGRNDWGGTYLYTAGENPSGSCASMPIWGGSYHVTAPTIVVTSDNSIYCFFDHGGYSSEDWDLWVTKCDVGNVPGSNDAWSSPVKIANDDEWTTARKYKACADYENNVHIVYVSNDDTKILHRYANAGDGIFSVAAEVPLPSGYSPSDYYLLYLFMNQKSGKLYLTKRGTNSGYKMPVWTWDSTGGWTCIDTIGSGAVNGYFAGIAQDADGNILAGVFEREHGYYGDYIYYNYKSTLADPTTWTKSLEVFRIDSSDPWGVSFGSKLNHMPQSSYPRGTQVPASGIAFLHSNAGNPNGMSFATTDFEYPVVNLQAHNTTNTIYFIR